MEDILSEMTELTEPDQNNLPLDRVPGSYTMALGGQIAAAAYDRETYCARGEDLRVGLAGDTEGKPLVLATADCSPAPAAELTIRLRADRAGRALVPGAAVTAVPLQCGFRSGGAIARAGRLGRRGIFLAVFKRLEVRRRFERGGQARACEKSG
jgi:hypothetical protein